MFPLAVRVQRRELHLLEKGTPTITGGMAFAGGPFNSFVLATAAMARRLREQPGLGLVTTVSGMLTKPGLAVWSSEPDGRPPLVGGLAAAASDIETIHVTRGHEGATTMAACTVTYASTQEGMEPEELVAILDTDGGNRVITKSSTRASSREPRLKSSSARSSPSPATDLEPALLLSGGDRFGAVLRAELVHDRRQVVPHRSFREEEVLGEVGHGGVLAGGAQHIAFARRQRVVALA